MPHWGRTLQTPGGGISAPSSRPSSRPGSRASSPTRTSRSSTLISQQSSREALPIGTSSSGTGASASAGGAGSSGAAGSGAGGAEPLDDYFFGRSHGSHTSSGAHTPGSGSIHTPAPVSTAAAAGATTPGGDAMWPGSSSLGNNAIITPGGSTPYHGHAPPIQIFLDSDHLVLRGYGNEVTPALLTGRVEVHLPDSTNVKEITMQMSCRAKVQFHDTTGTSSKYHHFTHNLAHHDWKFIGGQKAVTMKAGSHSFAFNLTIDGKHPSSIHTFNGDAVVQYRLRANLVRSGFVTHTQHAEKTFTVQRTFTPDALEFNQTLEIENTWPGKIMYSLTLPYKAYAAGDEIPVNVKFMPIAKGVRVTSVTSVLKEYSMIHTRHSNHSDTRVAVTVKHDIVNGRAVLVSSSEPFSTSHTSMAHRINSTSQLSSTSNSAANSRAPSRASSPSRTPTAPRAQLPVMSSATNSSAQPDRQRAASSASQQPNQSGPSSQRDEPASANADDEDIEIGDDEVDTSLTIPIPVYTTSTHNIHPVFIQHKIKWSCSILNADGHISELRCALPIVVLDSSLLEEAREASASTRNLLFGNTEETQVIDLPSYTNHVYDRVAVADSGSAAGFIPRSRHTTPHHSPQNTPPGSRPPSRPGSPTRGLSFASDTVAGPSDVPPRRELSEWADSELLLSLGALRAHSNDPSPNDTPPESRANSRPPSRRGSRSWAGSRNTSRAPSPERAVESPRPTRTGFLHLPKIKPHTGHVAAKPILRTSGAGVSHDSLPRQVASFTNVQNAAATASGSAHVQFTSQEAPQRRRTQMSEAITAPTTPDEVESNPLNVVPSYAVASRGFLGGGIVPLDTGLPTYDDSERQIERTRSSTMLALARPRSDTALVELGAAAAAEAEERAAEDARE